MSAAPNSRSETARAGASDDAQAPAGVVMSERNYWRWFVNAVLSISLVSVIPLSIMTMINYLQYQQAFHAESIRPIAHLTASAKLTLEFFLSERLSALELVIVEKTTAELRDQDELRALLINMKKAFRGFVDLGLIDQSGQQISYAGPYDLLGKGYSEQDWFHAVMQRGVYISDVFMGHRLMPHFVMAVLHETPDHERLILRATIDSEMLNNQIQALAQQPTSDAFIVNREGVLQTPSRYYGDVLEICNIAIPAYAQRPEVVETVDRQGGPLVMGYAYIKNSPFIAVLVNRPGALQESWISLRRELIGFLVISILFILLVVVWGSRRMVNRIKEADLKRATFFHTMEYTNKMASIGRLAAGVAHEINNPLAIINEKAGLLKDLYTLSAEPVEKNKALGLVNSVLNSVERCGAITHRLLGFAKRMDIKHEEINLELLIKEVLGFVGREAEYRNLKIGLAVAPETPAIESDRGQLQQVLLNIINNAFAAVSDGGTIDIRVAPEGLRRVAIRIADNGSGIPRENLDRIFEPFFTTKKGMGTGLGLSITYGIVQKLGGEIRVESKLGEGTCFTVVLPEGRIVN